MFATKATAAASQTVPVVRATRSVAHTAPSQQLPVAAANLPLQGPPTAGSTNADGAAHGWAGAAAPLTAFVAVAALVITAYRRLMHPRPQPLAELCLTDVPVMAIAPVIGKKGRKLNGAYTGYRQALSEVQVITNDELKDYLKKGYTLLDVRPNYERERIRPENSEHVEFIQEVESPWYDVVAFGRKWGNTAYAGCTRDFTRNPEFVPEVIKRFNKNSKLIIACGDGLRSLVACKLLQDEGCRDVVWVEAGLLTCESEPAMKSVGTQVDVGYKRAGLDLGLIWANAVDKFTGTTNKNYSYASLIEEQVEHFLKEQSLTMPQAVELIKRLPTEAQQQLISLDFINAALQYVDFLRFLREYADVYGQDPDSDNVLPLASH